MPVGVYKRTDFHKKIYLEKVAPKTRARHAKARQEKILYLNKTNNLICPKCKQEKNYNEFQVDKKRWSGRRSTCKNCMQKSYAENQNRYYHNNKEKISKKAKWYRHKYELNFSKEDYYKLLLKQHGVCAICKGNNGRKKFFYIDHNHKTGAVRGLLCQRCNTGLGFMRDSIFICRSAADYLEERGSYGTS